MSAWRVASVCFPWWGEYVVNEMINIWNKLLGKATGGEHRWIQETPRLVSRERELMSLGKQEGCIGFCKQSGYIEKDVVFSFCTIFTFLWTFNLYFKEYPPPPPSHCFWQTISFQLYLPRGQISLGLEHQKLFTLTVLANFAAYCTFIHSPGIIEGLALPVHSSSASTFSIVITAKSHSVWQNMLNVYGSSWRPLDSILKYFQIVQGNFMM